MTAGLLDTHNEHGFDLNWPLSGNRAMVYLIQSGYINEKTYLVIAISAF